MVALINELYQNEYDSDYGFSPHTVKEQDLGKQQKFLVELAPDAQPLFSEATKSQITHINFDKNPGELSYSENKEVALDFDKPISQTPAQ